MAKNWYDDDFGNDPGSELPGGSLFSDPTGPGDNDVVRPQTNTQELASAWREQPNVAIGSYLRERGIADRTPFAEYLKNNVGRGLENIYGFARDPDTYGPTFDDFHTFSEAYVNSFLNGGGSGHLADMFKNTFRSALSGDDATGAGALMQSYGDDIGQQYALLSEIISSFAPTTMSGMQQTMMQNTLGLLYERFFDANKNRLGTDGISFGDYLMNEAAEYIDFLGIFGI